MSRFPSGRSTSKTRVQHNAVALAKRSRHGVPQSKRARGMQRDVELPFAPPEDWYESAPESQADYRIVCQPPGEGYIHPVTPDEIRERLAQLSKGTLDDLEVVQLSRMTRKKRSFPCYGMQWGASLYLYPIETSLIEFYASPPRPAQLIEARMYGARWVQEGDQAWQLVWTEESIRDFYLNNILIHELGHLLDQRNRSYTDRERFAEWFSIEHGYKPSRRLARKAASRILRRHHKS